MPVAYKTKILQVAGVTGIARNIVEGYTGQKTFPQFAMAALII
jgi:hypothetical protein